MTMSERVRPSSPVPVIVIVYCPGGVSGLTVMVAVELNVGVPLDGVKLTDIPPCVES